MTYYELLTFLHISTSIIWLGAGFLFVVLVFGAERSGDQAKEAGHHQDVARLAPRLFIPASMSTLLLGILLVIEGSWNLDQLWIVIGLAGWTCAFVLGFFYFRPEGERIGALMAEHGPGQPEIERRIRRLNMIDRFQLSILFVVVAAMVIKPTGDDTGVLIAGAAILALGIAYALSAVRGPAAAASG